jgi:hypothetical protein
MFWIDTVLVTAFPLPAHKDRAIVGWIIVAIEVSAPSQTGLAISVAYDVFNFDATPATSFILCFFSW